MGAFFVILVFIVDFLCWAFWMLFLTEKNESLSCLSMSPRVEFHVSWQRRILGAGAFQETMTNTQQVTVEPLLWDQIQQEKWRCLRTGQTRRALIRWFTLITLLRIWGRDRSASMAAEVLPGECVRFGILFLCSHWMLTFLRKIYMALNISISIGSLFSFTS